YRLANQIHCHVVAADLVGDDAKKMEAIDDFDRSRGFSGSSLQLQQAGRLDDAAAPRPTARQSEPRLRPALQEWRFASPVSPPFVVVFDSLRRLGRSRLPQMTTASASMIAICSDLARFSFSRPNFSAPPPSCYSVAAGPVALSTCSLFWGHLSILICH